MTGTGRAPASRHMASLTDLLKDLPAVRGIQARGVEYARGAGLRRRTDQRHAADTSPMATPAPAISQRLEIFFGGSCGASFLMRAPMQTADCVERRSDGPSCQAGR